tara:strand:+ start:120418 stop:120672 length:255 start_codon:yes stop_codon:yes gene_type:complete
MEASDKLKRAERDSKTYFDAFLIEINQAEVVTSHIAIQANHFWRRFRTKNRLDLKPGINYENDPHRDSSPDAAIRSLAVYFKFW